VFARRAVLAVLVLGLLPAGAVTLAAAPACADSPHHAALIVDTGSGGGVYRFCVGFSAASITGKDVLDDAGMNPPPVYQQYGANGVAVCQLLGVGRDADHCLEAGNNWAYYRAAAGTTTFTYSNAGASSTAVHDGDVEGWIWEASSGPPPFTSESQICPPAAAPATTLPAGGVVSRTASTASAPAPAGGSPTTPATPIAGAAPTSTASPVGPTSSTAPERGLQVAARTAKRGGGGSSRSLIVFAVMLAGLIGWFFWVRRQRRRRRPILPG